MLCPKDCTEYYVNQSGTGLPYFAGRAIQRGSGYFSNLFRHVVPLIGKYFGRKILKTGVGVASDVLAGKDFKPSVKNRFIEMRDNIADDVVKKMQSGGRKRRKRKKSITTKRRKKDIFSG